MPKQRDPRLLGRLQSRGPYPVQNHCRWSNKIRAEQTVLPHTSERFPHQVPPWSAASSQLSADAWHRPRSPADMALPKASVNQLLTADVLIGAEAVKCTGHGADQLHHGPVNFSTHGHMSMNKQPTTPDNQHAFSASNSLEATQGHSHVMHDETPHTWTATAAAVMSAALAEFLEVFSQPATSYALDKQDRPTHPPHVMMSPAYDAYCHSSPYDIHSQRPLRSTSRQQHIDPQIHLGSHLPTETDPASWGQLSQHTQATTGSLRSQSAPACQTDGRQNTYPLFRSPELPLQSQVLESRVIALPVPPSSQLTHPPQCQHDSQAQVLLPIAPLLTLLSPLSSLQATAGRSASSTEHSQQLLAVDQQPQSGSDKACPLRLAEQAISHSQDHMALIGVPETPLVAPPQLGSMPAPATPDAADKTGLKRKKGGPQQITCQYISRAPGQDC